jgi:hypothetical protein
LIGKANKAGWLKQQSPRKDSKWSFRYFALVDQILYIYKQPTDKSAKKTIDFSKAAVDIELIPEDHPSIMIIFQYGSDNIVVKARDSSELEDWGSELELVSLQHKSAPIRPQVFRGMSLTSSRIYFNDLFPIIDTGDLLLYRSGNLTFQVSLFICYPDGDIGLLQADSIDGVQIASAEEIFHHFKSQRSISLIFRQLRAQRSQEVLMKFEEFVKNFEKKRFSVSPVSLLQDAKGSQSEVTACSAELVSSAFKSMGFLSSSVSATRYQPNHFSSANKLDLVGARLAEEVGIDLG